MSKFLKAAQKEIEQKKLTGVNFTGLEDQLEREGVDPRKLTFEVKKRALFLTLLALYNNKEKGIVLKTGSKVILQDHAFNYDMSDSQNAWLILQKGTHIVCVVD